MHKQQLGKVDMGNKKYTTPAFPLSNIKGSTIITALGMSVMIAIMIMVSAIYIRSRATAVMTSSNRMDERIAMDGMLAYTINGIKQSWCFSDTWAQQLNCTLNDPRNTVRLLISDESLRYIGNSATPRPTPLASTRVLQIQQTVSLTGINPSHPLFSIGAALRKNYKSVTFVIKRDDSAIATTKGQEVRLRIKITLPAVDADHPQLDLDSQIIVYPRELSYFGLIIPNNLYLGSTVNTKGDSGLANVAVAGTKGLRFESPVFVNGNLHLPTASTSTAMNNVIFLDKVVMGGMVYQDGKLFTPKNAGGEKQMYNNQLKSFNGLLGGFELDPERDAGLDYLFDLISGTTIPSDYQLCLKRISATYDLKVTVNSQLYTRYNSPNGTNSFRVSASLGTIDNFVEQSPDAGSNASGFTFGTDVDDVTSAGTASGWDGGAVFRAKMIYEGMTNNAGVRGDYYTDFYIPRSGNVTLTPLGPGAGKPEISIVASPHVYGTGQQYNQVNMTISFTNTGALNLNTATVGNVAKPGNIRLILEAFDYGYVYGENIRNIAATHPTLGPLKTNGFTFIKNSAGNMEIVNSNTAWSLSPILTEDLTNYPPADKTQEPSEQDFAAFDAGCLATPEPSAGSMYASFPAATWGTSFALQSKHAWTFSDKAGFTNGYMSGTLALDSGNSYYNGSTQNAVFDINSLVNECRIEASANFVTGFYTCNTLTISARTTPLRIIGTFIVGKLNIDPTAYTAGIRWSTIYHPQAVYEMRDAGILGKWRNNSGTINCDDPTVPPLWSPGLGVETAVKHYLCNPVSLRTANPFKWTTVDPDCGIDVAVDPMKTACKNQPRRFLIKEISRAKGM